MLNKRMLNRMDLKIVRGGQNFQIEPIDIDAPYSCFFQNWRYPNPDEWIKITDDEIKNIDDCKRIASEHYVAGDYTQDSSHPDAPAMTAEDFGYRP